jgi:hypothetical protein
MQSLSQINFYTMNGTFIIETLSLGYVIVNTRFLLSKCRTVSRHEGKRNSV